MRMACILFQYPPFSFQICCTLVHMATLLHPDDLLHLASVAGDNQEVMHNHMDKYRHLIGRDSDDAAAKSQ